MKIGDEVEVLYDGAWIAAKIVNQQNIETDPKQAPVRHYTVSTDKGTFGGLAVEHGNLRTPQRPATPGQGETADRK